MCGGLPSISSDTEMEREKDSGYKIIVIPDAVNCRVITRLNRFVVEVRMRDTSRRACINNTGRLHQFLVEGKKGFCLRNEKLGRTDYRLFAIEDELPGAIIDTRLQMKAFEEAVAQGVMPWLKGYRIVKRNARLGESLIDYLLAGNGKEVYLEVKSAVLREGHYAMYPDCPSSRGRRHVGQLAAYVRKGGEAIILFIAALPNIKAFKPNKAGDEVLCQLLRDAQQAGVVLRSVGMLYLPQDSSIRLFNADLPVSLE